MPVYGPNLDIASNGSWEFALIPQLPNEKAEYTPRSDALLCINHFPHLILEIVSEGNQSDRVRLLLQAACLARLGNKLGQNSKSPLIISAIYINNDLAAEWNFVHQSQASGAVS